MQHPYGMLGNYFCRTSINILLACATVLLTHNPAPRTRCLARSLATSCGSAASDAAVTAFAKGCRGLRRLSLRGVVGVPPPLGARGVLAVCSHCRELELLDLGEVRGLEDSALASFHDHQMEKLERVSLGRCRWLTCFASSAVELPRTRREQLVVTTSCRRYFGDCSTPPRRGAVTHRGPRSCTARFTWVKNKTLRACKRAVLTSGRRGNQFFYRCCDAIDPSLL